MDKISSVLLADPRYVVRAGLRNFFSYELPNVFIEEVTSSEAFVIALITHPHSVVVIHQSFLTEISHFPEGNIVVLAPKPDKGLFLLACEHHAIAYLGNEPSEHLLREALQLEPGKFLLDPAYASWILEHIGEHDKRHIKLELLTQREREKAELRNKGLSYEEVAKQLCIAVSTVKRHTANIRGRLKRETET